MFAFDADTGAFLGATSITAYSNARKWLVVDDVLYVGVGGAEGGGGSGAVLRWNGDKSTDPAVLFDFEVVGDVMDGIASELTEHQGRIYTATWPGGGGAAGIWMSPPIAELSARPIAEDPSDNNMGWVKIWSSSDYDPDPVTARTYGGGAIASFDGWVYWGTMHVPGVAALMHSSVYGESADQDALEERFLGTWRAISIFRGRNFGTADEEADEIELLYGGSSLPDVEPGHLQAYLCDDPSCNPFDPSAPRSWQTVPNKMGLTPLYGSGGFDNLFNNYCWTMRVFNGALYVGTMDHSYLILGQLDPIDYLQLLIFLGVNPVFGADLYRFDDSDSAAEAVSLDGMGNPMNYGIRTMVADYNALYLGSANPMNLNPDGGWELIELTPPEPDYNATGDWDITVTGLGPGNTCPDVNVDSVNITQTGNSVSMDMEIDGQTYTFTGTVGGSTYNLSVQYTDPGTGETETYFVTFTLSANKTGSGSITWTVRDAAAQPVCEGTAEFNFTKQGGTIQPLSADGGGGGGCFIKTAAYGLAVGMAGILILALVAAIIVTVMREKVR
jgi:hypothetical protein